MTENVNLSMGDVMQLYDTQSTKKAGGTLSTVLGIIGAVIVLALIWNAYTRARDTRANTDAIASGALGSIQSSVDNLNGEVAAVVRHERADAIKLAYTDGVLFGRPHGNCYPGGFYPAQGFGYPGYPMPGYPGFGYPFPGHGCEKDCGPKQQFREVRTFTEDTDTIQVTNTCGPSVA